MPPTLEVLKALSVLLVPLGVGWLGGWWNMKSKRAEISAAPYDVLAERVSKLETQVYQLQVWSGVVVPLHMDITNRWAWYRMQETAPDFPPLPSENTRKEEK